MAEAVPQSDGAAAPEAAFDLLAEGVQRQLYRMGWQSLRPIQADAIRAYMRTEADLLIMAETAGGKTEAAFLPVLSSISEEPAGSVRAMYIGPLKALINDQFGRLEELCTYLEMPVHRWHGDVGAGKKDALLKSPGGVLLITPESLESALINRTAMLPALFGGLRAVVIDEVHAFLDSERGLHLASLLSRVRRYQGVDEKPWRVIGLSATVGDVGAAQRYLSPDASDRVTVITDPSGGKEIQFRVHGYAERPTTPVLEADEQEEAEGSTGQEEASEDASYLDLMGRIAADMFEHCRMHSNLVFANRKADIEILADLCNERCREAGLPETFLVHHGSLAREVREDSEGLMKSGRAMTTVCSSTLEMGIDIGSVRLVGQVGAPWSVASLKQRMGRGGRKDGEPRRLRVYTAIEKDGADALERLPLELVQTVAVCELMLRKWVEPPRPARLDLSTLTHQAISTIAETGAISAAELHSRLCVEGPFRAVTPGVFARVLRRLGAGDILEQGPDGRLILGLAGERIRTRHDFYAAFAGQAEYTVVAGERALGMLPMVGLPKVGEHIVLAARRWQVEAVDDVKMVLHVRPARRRKRARFGGRGGEVDPGVREEMRTVLAGDTGPIYLDAEAAAALAAAQRSAQESGLAARGIVGLGGASCLWLTWTGTAAQRVLLALLEEMGVEARDREGVAIECGASAGALKGLLREPPANRLDPLRLAARVRPKQVRKFDALLDDALLDEGIASDRMDVAAADAVIRASARV